MKLTRNYYIPCLDISSTGEGVGSNGPEWCPIDKSTVYELTFNANTEEYDYICYASTMTETTGYSLEMAQEITLDSKNPMYLYMHKLMWRAVENPSLTVPLLLIEPIVQSGDVKAIGRRFDENTVAFDSMNTVDGKISFTLHPNGTPAVGTVTITSENVITFSEVSSSSGTMSEDAPAVANAVVTAQSEYASAAKVDLFM